MGNSYVIIITGVVGSSYSQLCVPKEFLLSKRIITTIKFLGLELLNFEFCF